MKRCKQPDAFFNNQSLGELFLELAPEVPLPGSRSLVQRSQHALVSQRRF